MTTGTLYPFMFASTVIIYAQDEEEAFDLLTEKFIDEPYLILDIGRWAIDPIAEFPPIDLGN